LKAGGATYWASPEGIEHKRKLAEQQVAKTRRVSINGDIYNSVKEAAIYLNLPEPTIRSRMNTKSCYNSTYNASWFFLPD
jgi:hypothetical protein